MPGPEGDKLIRVNMSDQTVAIEDFPEEWKYQGGRSLSAKILLRDCDPSCDPLGPDNVLVMAPGVMSGTTAPTSGRISIGGKSPLTGSIKEANAGGNPGQHLMKLGFRAIIVQGQPADPEKRYGLEISADGLEVVAADEYKGMWNYACCEKLLTGRDKNASVICIGPAGEMQLAGASVACTDQDKERRPARHAARGGLGAVMGSKGLKWVVVDPGKARPRQAADSKGFNAQNKGYSKAYIEAPQMFEFGTSSVVPVANILSNTSLAMFEFRVPESTNVWSSTICPGAIFTSSKSKPDWLVSRVISPKSQLPTGLARSPAGRSAELPALSASSK